MSFPTQDPDRLAFAKLDTGEVLEVQFNPTELKEKLEPVYQRLAPVGMSYEQLQYVNTKNFVVEFDVFFDAVTPYRGGMYDVDSARKFFLSLGIPRRNAQPLAGGAPTDVLMMWPNVYTLTTKLTTFDGKLTTFAQDGSILRWSAHVVLEEIRNMRLWAEDVEVQGTRRPASSPVDPSSATANG